MATITFGKLGDGYPVPALTTTSTDRQTLIHEIEDHAQPHLTEALTTMGCSELADAFFHPNADMTGGQFLHLSLATEQVARFCAVRITTETTEGSR